MKDPGSHHYGQHVRQYGIEHLKRAFGQVPTHAAARDHHGNESGNDQHTYNQQEPLVNAQLLVEAIEFALGTDLD